MVLWGNKLLFSLLWCCMSDADIWSHCSSNEAWKRLSKSFWMEVKMKSFHHRLISASSLVAAHKRSIYSETYPETFPVYTDPMLELSHAGSRGSGSGGERLNNALIQLVRLLVAPSSARRLRQEWDRGRAGKTVRKCLQNEACLCVNELEGQGGCCNI